MREVNFRSKYGEFCKSCGDYISHPIGRERDCQACEKYNPEPASQKVKFIMYSEPDTWEFKSVNIEPLDIPFKAQKKKYFYKEITPEIFDFYDHNNHSYRGTRVNGRVRLIYEGLTIERATPGGVCAALNELLG